MLKMAGKISDSEQQRQIDRIMRVAFRIARDAGATFINLKIENRKLKIEKSNRIENRKFALLIPISFEGCS